MSDAAEVYVAHGPADADWTALLAHALESRGAPVFLQQWDVVPGNVRVNRIDQGLHGCRSAVIVVGAADLAGEYPALLEMADRGRIQLVPVLRERAATPPLLSAYLPVTFSGADSRPDFDERVDALLRALRAAPVVRRGFAAPDFGIVAEGPVTVRLRITERRTVLIAPDGAETVAEHPGPQPALEQLGWDVTRAQRTARGASAALARLGDGLGRTFLPGPVGTTLAGLLDTAVRLNRSLTVSLEIDPRHPGLHALHWECLSLPGTGTILAMQPVVRLRRFTDLGATTRPDIPGPLRILAVVAGPDAEGHELVDHEHELGMILRRVQSARAGGGARVRVLNWGSARAIRAALQDGERFHILHLSCPAEPGVLLLETADGATDRMDAARFADEVLPPDGLVPLIVLAGCSAVKQATGLSGFAQALLSYGVPTVLAMTAPVTDHYATELLARAYGRLAAATAPVSPLTVLADLRRAIEQERPGRPAGDPLARLPEWHAPAVFTRVRDSTLYDPRLPAGAAAGHPEPDRGDFVGRRTDLRGLLRALRPGGSHSGVLIHGIGGIGKSTLAGQLAGMLADAGDPLLVAPRAPHTAERILRAVAFQLRSRLPDAEGRALRGRLTDTEDDWIDRLDLLTDELTARHLTVLLLLDDPLGDPLDGADPEAALDTDLRDFLRRWLRLECGARLLVTARRADALGFADRRLLTWQLGPLSRAETGKLIWRLPGVHALSPPDQDRAYQDLGGHPRALEYLNGLLQAGRPATGQPTGARSDGKRFDDVADRMETNLRGRGIADPERWMGEAGKSVDTALAATVAGISAEVLLDRLLDQLRDSAPRARELLLAAAVYRRPVDRTGLLWAVAEPAAPDPDRSARLRRWYDALIELRAVDADATLADVALPGRDQLHRDLAAGTRPPEVPWLDPARDELVRLGLLTPVPGRDGVRRWMVHRWTAGSLAGREPDETRHAHRRAAAYHRWWAALNARDPGYDHHDLEEARHHCTAVDDLDQLLSVASQWCVILHEAGAFRQEEIVCAETVARLERLAPDHPEIWYFTHQLGVIAMRQGRYPEAETHHRRCRELAAASGDLLAEATSFRELGSLAQLSGDRAAAVEYYQKAIGCCGAQATSAALAVLASCYQLRGAMDLAREDGEAWRWSIGAYQIARELRERTGPAGGERELGQLARAFGDLTLADEHEFRTHESAGYAADLRRLIATSALQTGTVELLHGMPLMALTFLRHAQDAAAGTGDRLLLAQCHRLLGDVLFQVGRHEEATTAYRELAELADQLDDPLLQAVAEQQLARVTGDRHPDDATGVAEAHFAEADRIARRLGSLPLLAAGRLYRGELAELAGRADQARAAFQAAVTAADECQDLAVWTSAALRLGSLDAGAGNAGAAADWFHRAVARSHESGNSRAEALGRVALGMLAWENGDRDAADEALAVAERVATTGGHRPLAVSCQLHRATLAGDRSRFGAAERHYAHALALLDERTHPGLVAETHRRRGRDRVQRGQWTEAAEDLTAALRIFGRYAIPEAVAWCRLHLWRALIEIGDMEQAAHLALRCAAPTETLLPSPLRIAALIATGEELCTTGDRSGFALLEAALADAETVEPEPGSLVAGCRRALAHALRAHGAPAAAITQLREAHRIAGLINDPLAAVHDERDLGRALLASGDRDQGRTWLAASARHAARMRQERELAAATELLDGVLASATLTGVESQWRDLQWVRRLRAADGERGFTGTPRAHVGPSVNEVLRTMGTRHSPAAGVPFAVGPHRMTRRSHRS
ncbi:tetratricopeptide repeat protein [Actinoplanes oblitus]|uniref:Tetratricopeptide repeat protein n=1 Tax=Actinoplanes oblitus TaxID=3040509 RepID=A0ABY8W6Y3_9ACTN|nr:tetratricopeptide repeat protein [Actinoplanes oblitus]WIM93428.1 tetratricopeptide repeat protein [Actinoplanes oblitus]